MVDGSGFPSMPKKVGREGGLVMFVNVCTGVSECGVIKAVTVSGCCDNSDERILV